MKIKTAAKLLTALSKPLNLRVLNLLRAESLFVCELVRLLDVPQPTLSNALRELRLLGLVEQKPFGRWRLYSLGDVPRWVFELLDELELSKDEEKLADYLRRGREVCGVNLKEVKDAQGSF